MYIYTPGYVLRVLGDVERRQRGLRVAAATAKRRLI